MPFLIEVPYKCLLLFVCYCYQTSPVLSDSLKTIFSIVYIITRQCSPLTKWSFYWIKWQSPDSRALRLLPTRSMKRRRHLLHIYNDFISKGLRQYASKEHSTIRIQSTTSSTKLL